MPDFYEVLNNRRTIRDFSDKNVGNDVLNRILKAAFNAPTNDHLRQFEFVVIRDRSKIAKLVAPVSKNTKEIQQNALDSAISMDEDEHAMFLDALPKQQRMLTQSGCLVLPFFKQKDVPLCKPVEQCSLNYFASAWAAVENILLAATAEGLACAFRIPINNESEYVKKELGVPNEYEFTCFLAIGYAAENAHICKQKVINIADRIHKDTW